MRCAIVGLLTLAMACSEPAAPPPPPPEPSAPEEAPPEVFIALSRDFVGFEDWRRFDLEDPVIPFGHPAGPAAVYINRMPPDGVRTFPVGTILIKAIEQGEREDWVIHAMAKRGGGYGRSLPGWELFELAFVDGTPTIAWRGEGAPAGGGYAVQGADGEVAEVDCATCHSPGWTNDNVLNEHVRLAYSARR